MYMYIYIYIYNQQRNKQSTSNKMICKGKEYQNLSTIKH